MLDSERDWFFRHPELSCNEALLLCEIRRWPNGCYKSSASIARSIKLHPRTVQRLVKQLYKRQWVAILYQRNHSRTLYVTPKDPPVGPLFDYKENAEKVIQNYRQKELATLFDHVAQKRTANQL